MPARILAPGSAHRMCHASVLPSCPGPAAASALQPARASLAASARRSAASGRDQMRFDASIDFLFIDLSYYLIMFFQKHFFAHLDIFFLQ